jgi:iron complex transport system substrate-binding protein
MAEKRRWRALAFGLLWAWVTLASVASLALQAHAAPASRPADLASPHTPKRIVSLLPSLTESVCALGACESLVGVDRYSNWPAAVRALPRVGGGIDPNLESIFALKPDLVVATQATRGLQRLESLGLRVVVLNLENHADVHRVLRELAAVLGLPTATAERVWQDIQSGLAVARTGVPASVLGARVYFEVNPAPYAAGAASFIGQTLAALGVDNIVPLSMGPFPRLNPEWVVQANPEVIFAGGHEAAAMGQRPGWVRIRAIEMGRVCSFTPDEADVLVRPGPRLAEAARLMARCLVDTAPTAPGRRP